MLIKQVVLAIQVHILVFLIRYMILMI